MITLDGRSSQKTLLDVLSVCRRLEADFYVRPLDEWCQLFVNAVKGPAAMQSNDADYESSMLVFAECLHWLGFASPEPPDRIARLLSEHVKAGTLSAGLILRWHRATSPAQVAAQCLETNFDQHITLEALAEIARVPTRVLMSAFVTQYGCSPQEYLGRVRLSRAGLLIRQGVKKEVAARLVGMSRSTLYRKAKHASAKRDSEPHLVRATTSLPHHNG